MSLNLKKAKRQHVSRGFVHCEFLPTTVFREKCKKTGTGETRFTLQGKNPAHILEGLTLHIFNSTYCNTFSGLKACKATIFCYCLQPQNVPTLPILSSSGGSNAVLTSLTVGAKVQSNKSQKKVKGEK